jgi:cytochrome P450/NADPH-cytochrome P450 reductase
MSMLTTFTIKPKGFYMRAHLRNHMSPTTLERALASTSISEHAGEKKAQGTKKKVAAQGKPMAVYYGSNTGTCEALANRLASDAPNHGFSAIVDTLDAVKGNLPKDRPIAIITASYEGQPTDNAAFFVEWLNNLTGSELTDLQYSVFGCGHRDWASTFHIVPIGKKEYVPVRSRYVLDTETSYLTPLF